MASFGETLREARKARNISLQEIAAITKIGTRALQALEDERFDLLPGGIFNKGFVRSYARCVGLDEEKTVAAYIAAAKVVPSETDVHAISSQLYGSRMAEPDPWWANAKAIVGVVAIIVALGMGALWLKEHLKEAKELAASEHRVESPAMSTGTPDSIPAQTTAANDPNAAANGTLNTSQNPNQGTIQTGNQVNGAVNTAGSVAPQPVAVVPTPTKEAAAPVEISISATSRAWISVRGDGKAIETLTLDPGKPELSTRSYKAREKLMLTVGNPAGVSVTYNGKPMGVLGVEGHRMVITFTPQGMVKE